MITMRAHLLLLLLLLAVAAAPLTSTALSPEELAPEKKISGVNPGAYAAEQQKLEPAADVKEEVPKIVAGANSNVMGGAAGGLNYAGGEKKPEGKSDDAVKKPMENPGDKVIPGVKTAEKSNVYENAVASEKKALDAVKKSKIKSEEAEEKAEEKKLKIKSESLGYDKTEKKPKNKSDDVEEAEAKKKPKNKSDDIEDAEAKKKSKNKRDDIEDAEAKKKPENKSDSYEDAGAEKKEKKAKSKDEDSSEDTKKKSESKSEAYEDGSTKKKSKKKKKSGSSSEEDFDAVPMETPADGTPAADTPDGYAAPTTQTMAATDSPDGYAAPTTQTMAATDSPDGYVPASDSPEGAVPASDSPDGYAAPTTQTMAATDSPDGYVPATDSPDGEVPASDSPDGYDASTDKSSSNKVNVQSFDDAALPVPEPVLKMLSPIIKAQCAKTEYPSVCETSIAKLPFIPPVLDGVGVLKLAMDAVRARIQEAKNDALEVANEPGISKLAKGAISDCLQLYDDISYSYDNALAALKRGDKASAVAAVDGARTDIDTCDSGFRQSSRGYKPPLAGQEKLLAKLSSNVLCMNRNLKLY